MKLFRKIFHREAQPAPQPLRISGVGEAPMTPEPDDAEVAAQALLEYMTTLTKEKATTRKGEQIDAVIHTPEYYRKLAQRIRDAHTSAELHARRFVTFCEQELRKPNLPREGAKSLGLLEAELYKRIDIIEREGGELKKRWQRCLAEVTVRMMGITNH